MSKECKRNVNPCKFLNYYSYLQLSMKKNLLQKLCWGICIITMASLLNCTDSTIDVQSAQGKLAMREVGHKLLLADGDSTSRVMPVVETSPSEFKLYFDKDLNLHPDSLVQIVQKTIKKTNLPEAYLVEVLQCADGQVAYSFEINSNKEDIIPCLGRALPVECYSLHLRFNDLRHSFFEASSTLYLSLAFIGVTLFFLYKKKEEEFPIESSNDECISIGKYQFYPKQHLLKIGEESINLSRKECELLAIFAAKPNTVIPRETLSKKVWEEQGVIVGRSLDTYVSKLRKILNRDAVTITNIHGVGYKLEVEEAL